MRPTTATTAKPARGRPREFDRDIALRKAKDLFWERGYAGTSIADLTTTLGISLPSLYAAFGGKNQLFQEVVTAYIQEDAAPLVIALEKTDVVEAIQGWLLAAVALYAGREAVKGCLVVTSAINTSPEDRGQVENLRRLRTDVGKNIQSRLRRSAQQGELKVDTDVDALAEFYHTYLQGLAIRARDGQTAERLIATIETAMLPLRAAARRTRRQQS